MREGRGRGRPERAPPSTRREGGRNTHIKQAGYVFVHYYRFVCGNPYIYIYIYIYMQSNAKQCDAMRSNAKQCKATQSKAMQSIRFLGFGGRGKGCHMLRFLRIGGVGKGDGVTCYGF